MTTTTLTQTVTNRVAAAAFVLLTMFALLTGIVNQAQAAPVAQAGSSSLTAKVPAQTANVSYAAAGVRQASDPWGVTAKKTAAFTKCIFGVGVPIGLVPASRQTRWCGSTSLVSVRFPRVLEEPRPSTSARSRKTARTRCVRPLTQERLAVGRVDNTSPAPTAAPAIRVFALRQTWLGPR